MASATWGTSRKHIVTVNVEDYFQVGAFRQFIPFEHWERFETRIQRNVEATLELLDGTGNNATFFASGWMGENNGPILRMIIDAGHEVGCSGYYQQSVRDIPPPAFRQDLRRSRDAIEDATGKKIQGFRIGRGRIGPEDLWVFKVLVEEGFSFDSSICPIGRQFATQPEQFLLHKLHTEAGDLWSVPSSSLRNFGWAIPFSGGNYIRQLPAWPIREAAARWVERREAPLVMYFHIWELDNEQPNISAAPFMQRIRHYRNLYKMSDRVRYFLEKYPFTSIGNYLELSRAPPATPIATVDSDEPQVTRFISGDRAKELTIVVPCYNEEAALDYLARTLSSFIEASTERIHARFVFVDDGSSDSTWNKLHLAFGDFPACEFVRHLENKGIAAAILTGCDHAQTELVAVLDADCTFDPMQLNEMIVLMSADVDAVCASPFHTGGSAASVPKWRLLLSRGAALLYRCVLKHQFSSYTSCFRIYRRHALSGMRVHFRGFCGVTEILARLDFRGHKLVECPAILQVRVLGQSKINLANTVCDHLKLLLRLAGARWLRIPLPDNAPDFNA